MSPCLRLPNGIVCCGSATYEYRGYLFEWHSYLGPALLNRRNLSIRESVPAGFWRAMDSFGRLTKEEREQYRATDEKP